MKERKKERTITEEYRTDNRNLNWGKIKTFSILKKEKKKERKEERKKEKDGRKRHVDV